MIVLSLSPFAEVRVYYYYYYYYLYLVQARSGSHMQSKADLLLLVKPSSTCTYFRIGLVLNQRYTCMHEGSQYLRTVCIV